MYKISQLHDSASKSIVEAIVDTEPPAHNRTPPRISRHVQSPPMACERGCMFTQAKRNIIPIARRTIGTVRIPARDAERLAHMSAATVPAIYGRPKPATFKFNGSFRIWKHVRRRCVTDNTPLITPSRPL